MRSRNSITILILLVIPLFLTGILTTIPIEQGNSDVASELVKISHSSYIERGPLVINNNSHLIDLDATYSWEGNGLEGSPIVIEGYNITSDSNCIVIGNVSLYFEIRDCYFNSISTAPYQSYGVIFKNVTHGLVVDTYVVNKNHGIWLNSSHYNTVQNCTVWDCSGFGIDFSYSNHSLLDESTVYDCGSNMELRYCYFTDVMRNDIYGSMGGGIHSAGSRNCTFEENTIHNNEMGFSQSGIYLYDTDNSVLIANEIYENRMHGIYLEDCQHNNITGNHIYNNTDHGIDLVFSENITILQNNIHDNGWRPTMINAKCGIYLEPSIDIDIEGNQIWNNTPTGITLAGSIYTTIVDNTIFNNTDHGILGFDAGDIDVIDNEIHGNGWSPLAMVIVSCGIHNDNGDNWNIESNEIWNNTNHGIYSSGDNVNITGNRIWDSNNSGIFVDGGGLYRIDGNTIFDNELGINLISIMTNVTSNIAYDNVYGIFTDLITDCFIYDNDLGWNTVNAFQSITDDGTNFWHNNESLGNWWHDYTGTGNYSIYNSTEINNYDIYPQRNMYVNPATENAHEISTVDNEMVWNAFAHNPLEFALMVNGSLSDALEWDGNDITLNVDALGAGYHELELFVYHISGHNFSASSSVNVTDLTAPSWIIGPSDQVINEGDVLYAQFSADDESGIGSWVINDTINFHIDSTGLLTNNTALPVGDYGLRVYVYDTFGNAADWEIRIRVLYVEPTTTTPTDTIPTTTTPTTPTGTSTTNETLPFIDETTLLAITVGAGGVIIVIVVLVIMKKKS